MKKLFYLFTILFAVLFAACEGTEPPTSNKVETGASENITQTSATLKGAVNVDIADYNSVEFGIMYDTLLAEVNNRSAQMIKGSVLMGKDFSINLADLTENTKYYYCAYLLLNGMQYEFGAVKEFTTLVSIEDPDTPDVSAYTAVFIRGQFNEWGETYELTTTDGDYYALDATFDLTGEFKIASSDWRTINYGGTYTIFADTEQVLIKNTSYNLTAYGTISVAKVEFTVSTGTLLITAAQTPSTPDTSDVPSSATGVANGHEYVDLGLSVKWATCNVGANSPEKYGNYFNWLEGSSTNSSDFIVVVPLNRDGANINWGGSWRIPSINEWDELISRCTWLWTTQKGIKGYKVISNINKKSIFIPAAGYREQSGVKDVGSWGEYWANSLFLIDDLGFPSVHTICFSDIGYECSNANAAFVDLPIRAVHP